MCLCWPVCICLLTSPNTVKPKHITSTVSSMLVLMSSLLSSFIFIFKFNHPFHARQSMLFAMRMHFLHWPTKSWSVFYVSSEYLYFFIWEKFFYTHRLGYWALGLGGTVETQPCSCEKNVCTWKLHCFITSSKIHQSDREIVMCCDKKQIIFSISSVAWYVMVCCWYFNTFAL